META
jgi:hypothetical protein